jgi:signal transduction histidine kinase
MSHRIQLLSAPRAIGGLLVLAGIISLILAPIIGEAVFTTLWGVEPLSYIGATLSMAGLAAISVSYLIPGVRGEKAGQRGASKGAAQHWSRTTQRYFELFDHDLGRPLRRIVGKERELQAILQSSGAEVAPGVKELLHEIERQAPNFRLMMSNIQALIQLEAPDGAVTFHPVEPTELLRKVVDRYTPVAAESQREITWWAEPSEFGIVYADRSVIEHVVTNLVDNAVRFATSHIEVKLTQNPSHFLIRVRDDGPGIAPHYMPHIFDRGWTPEVAKGEEKPSSGLGLFIARTLARRCGGDLTLESIAAPDPHHHTAFLLALPLRGPDVELS